MMTEPVSVRVIKQTGKERERETVRRMTNDGEEGAEREGIIKRHCCLECRDRLATGWAARCSNPGVEGRDFPHPSRPAPGAHPASCTMGTGSFPGVKRPGRDEHPPQSSAEVKVRVELYICSLSGTSWRCYRVELYLECGGKGHCCKAHRFVRSYPGFTRSSF